MGTAEPAAPVPVERIEVLAYQIPTDGPDGRESGGTLEWDSTTCVVVLASAAGQTGVGYTYGDVAVAHLIDSKLAGLALGADALAPAALWRAMFAQLRNLGRPGAGAMAVAAVDTAVWDLRARLLGQPLQRSLPAFHDRVPVYGSGGFTNYPNRAPRPAAHRMGGAGHPARQEDVTGLHQVRDAGPPGLDIAAGEYGFVLSDFARLLDSRAVDCLQADVTRCGGITGLLQVAGLAAAHQVDLSAHCAPALSAHAFCAVERLRHLEYFHDHVRIESMLFEGTLNPAGGALCPDPSRPGLGLCLRAADAETYLIHRTAHAPG